MTLHVHDWCVIGWIILSFIAALVVGRAMACSPDGDDDDL